MTLILWPWALCVKYLTQHYTVDCLLLAVSAGPVLVQEEAGVKAAWLALALTHHGQPQAAPTPCPHVACGPWDGRWIPCSVFLPLKLLK